MVPPREERIGNPGDRRGQDHLHRAELPSRAAVKPSIAYDEDDAKDNLGTPMQSFSTIVHTSSTLPAGAHVESEASKPESRRYTRPHAL